MNNQIPRLLVVFRDPSDDGRQPAEYSKGVADPGRLNTEAWMDQARSRGFCVVRDGDRRVYVPWHSIINVAVEG